MKSIEMGKSKPLGHDDSSGFEFVCEILNGDATSAINFDRLQYHPDYGYIIFEYLCCDEKQEHVTPWSSHPNKYWNKNKSKFISLFKAALALNATLYFVNYAKQGTEHENEICIFEIKKISTQKGIMKEVNWKTTRSEFQAWFREVNKECLFDYDGSDDIFEATEKGGPLDDICDDKVEVVYCEKCMHKLTSRQKEYCEENYSGNYYCFGCQRTI